MAQEKTPSWKSFLFAIVGAYAIFLSIYLNDWLQARGDTFGQTMFAIWGICFWGGGVGNLIVDRRLQRAAQKEKL